MIELYDPLRLKPARRPSPLALLALPMAVVGAVAAYGLNLQTKLSDVQAQTQALQNKLRAQAPPSQPNPALLADLQRQLSTRQSELELAKADSEQAWPPSSWLERLNALATPGVSLQKVVVDRKGEVLIEGLATGAQPVSGFTQAWDRQEQLAAMPPRSLELRQDKLSPDQLRFQMRASPARPGT